ncbi:VOC family protein [Lichenifustis flavocetrariae]|uniref:VOC family protein n=1 Tax=Lichenifustis flavocetrariae TaxID=2949735 RepID=A0AA42CKY4_9HYPH|nr:VOC family protein [Lichenifustis flavocetrariae]MCW6511028.1 VOC family protein [Lichenifustis flavocetrariae]
MPVARFILLFVESPEASTRWYAALLEEQPIEQSPTFAMFRLAEGLMLGIWSRHTASPIVTAQPGGSEIGFTVANAASVEATHAAWTAKGVVIAQAPTVMDFGTTFVGLDPDGHRLRVFAPVT